MSDSPSSPSHRFRAFGLTFASALPLPELLPAEAGSVADVDIRYGPVPPELPGVLARGVRYQSAPGALRLRVDGVADYLVRDGRTITIARQPQAVDDDVRVFLLGSAFGALLQQRGDLVLHGSAVEWQGEAVAFVGRSGTGKSTLASAFRRRGHAVLTDDVCVVRPDAGGRMCAHPGFPQAKLWLDSLKQLEFDPAGLRRIRGKLEKRAVPLADAFRDEPRRLRKLYVLRSHNRDELKIAPLSGPAKFTALKNQTFRFGFLAAIDAKAAHFQHAMRLAQQAELSAVTRGDDLARLDELVAALEADLRP
jgi:hypothetical protein